MSDRLRIHSTSLPGITRLERVPISDDRGFLERIYCTDELAEIGFHHPIAQINRTVTQRRGIIRGMHFQRPPYAATKLISCLHGEIFDVAIDLRQGSPTYLRWHGEVLSGTNNISLIVSEGFAHGFQTLSADCEILYCDTAGYMPSSADGVNARDETLAIAWPLEITGMSDRDAAWPPIAAGFGMNL